MTELDISIEKYLAGMMQGEELQQFENRRQIDETLQHRLAQAEAISARVRAAAREIDSAPMSQSLLATIEAAGKSPQNSRGLRNVQSWMQGLPPIVPRLLGPVALACIAAAAIVVLRPHALQPDSSVYVGSMNISAFADTLPAGVAAANLQFTGSYRRGDGGVCRVFELSAPNKQQGLICARGDAWTLVAMTGKPAGAYSPAGAQSDFIDAYLATMAPLSSAEERVFLGSRNVNTQP
ncbi:MAG: hypothetical protein AAF607_09035 [Pseudomonadota bacterium]